MKGLFMSKKKIIFDCPLKVVLTDSGLNAMLESGKKFSRLKIVDGTEPYGLNLSRFSFQALRQLFELKYAQKLEMPVYNCRQSQNDIHDISKLLIYYSFYRKFDYEIFSLFSLSPLIAHWDRLGTGLELKESLSINESVIQSIAEKKHLDIQKVKDDVLSPIQQSIIDDYQLNPSMKNLRLLMAEKYINVVRPVVWLCMAMQKAESDEYESFSMLIRDHLGQYFEKAEVAQMLGRMIYDILLEREQKSLQAFIAKNYKNLSLSNQIMEDVEFRRRIYSELADSDEAIVFSWQIDTLDNLKNSLTYKMSMEIYSTASDFVDMNTLINEASVLSVGKYDIEDLCVPQINEKINPKNNPYFLIAFFARQCKAANVNFQIFTHTTSNRKNSVVKINLNF